MLLHLHVKNLALIREAEIDFTEGLNILTGETGAGKSIIIGSMMMALGGKASREMIREDADYALVELVFSADNQEVQEKLLNLGISAEDNQVILSRKISGGRSICRLNKETVNISVLREIAACLIDIYGQHEHQSLLNKKKHLEVLDAYAIQSLQPVQKKIAASYQEWQDLKKALDKVDLDENAREREQSLLEFELNEIEEAALKEGEDAELEQNYRRMANSRKIMETLTAIQAICEGEEASVCDLTGRACRELSGIVQYDENLTNLSEQIQEIDSMLADFGRELGNYMESLEFSEQEFSETEQRLNLLNHLKAKYGQSIEDILKYQEEQQKRLDTLVHYEQYTEKLKQDYEKAFAELKKHCKKAHEIRDKASKKLSKLMKKQLKELNFLDVQFEIVVRETEQYTANGLDDVEFLISTNPGEPLKPLGKIASGGELSRVMLAIKTVLADQDAIETVIFDEIDTGISGRTAQKVSEKLAIIGKSRQVICITHLAQIAAMADSHFYIEKQAADGITTTSIRRIKEEETVEELARILGGAKITDAVRDNAREMKKLAEKFKNLEEV